MISMQLSEVPRECPAPVKVLCLSTWPAGSAPAIRFRCEAYIPWLSTLNVETDLYSFFDRRTYARFRSRGFFYRGVAIICSALRVPGLFLRSRRYHVIWLLREASPVGPPWIEFVIGRLLGKPIVYEFDDAIWTSPHPETFLGKVIRQRSKVVTNITHARHVIAGNEFLAGFAAKYSNDISVVPTCVDVERRFNFTILHTARPNVVIGWTGSRSTNLYLDMLVQSLCDLQRHQHFEVAIISDELPQNFLFPFRFLPWHPETEISDLSRFDIGVMPLADTDWERGKCGFKLVQYMALGIPVVASDVGHNREIVRHGVDGYLCGSNEEWVGCLEDLIARPDLRARLGRNARVRIEERFSIQANVRKIADIMVDAAYCRTHA